MTSWLGSLLHSGVLDGANAEGEVGDALAAFVVGEPALETLRTFVREAPSEIVAREKRAAIEVCIWMANADRKLADEEAALLRTLVEQSGLDESEKDELRAAVDDLPSLEDLEARLTQPVLRELLLALCWELAQSDGHVDRFEEAFQTGLARRLRVDDARAEQIRGALTQRISLAP